MTENHTSLAHFYDGWDVYQQQLSKAISFPLFHLISLPCVPLHTFAQLERSPRILSQYVPGRDFTLFDG